MMEYNLEEQKNQRELFNLLYLQQMDQIEQEQQYQLQLLMQQRHYDKTRFAERQKVCCCTPDHTFAHVLSMINKERKPTKAVFKATLILIPSLILLKMSLEQLVVCVFLSASL